MRQNAMAVLYVAACCFFVSPAFAQTNADFNQCITLYSAQAQQLVKANGMGSVGTIPTTTRTQQCEDVVYEDQGLILANFANCCETLNAGPPSSSAPPAVHPEVNCGSVVHVDDLALGEQVAVAGTPFFLSYFTDRSAYRTADYTINTPIKTAGFVTGEVTDIQVAVQNLGSGYYKDYNPVPTAANPIDSFLWNGKDQNGVTLQGPQKATLILTYIYAGGLNYPQYFNVTVGSYQPLAFGADGWDISPHHFYDVATSTLYFGYGGNRPVTAILQADGTLLATSSDGSEAYVFSSLGIHLKTLNGLTGATLYSFAYNASGKLLSVTDSFGNLTQIIRNTQGVPTQIKAPFGQVTSLVVTSTGLLTSIVDPLGNTTKMTYSTAVSPGLLASFQKPSGETSAFTYTAQGYLQKDQSTSGASLSYVSANLGSFSQSSIGLTTALGRQTQYTTTPGPAIGTLQPLLEDRTEIDPDGNATSYSYTAGSSNIVTTPLYTQTDYFGSDPRFGGMVDSLVSRTVNFPAYGNLATSISSSVTSTGTSLFGYTSLDTQTTINNKTWLNHFALAPRASTTTSPMGAQLIQTITTQGRLSTVQRASFLPQKFVHDSYGRVVSVAQGARSATLSYDSQGYLASVKNSLGQTTSFVNDALGRALKETLPDGSVIQYAYDANGNLISVTPPSRPVTVLGYNLFDLLASFVPPLLMTGQAHATSYSYNVDKQLTKIQFPDQSVATLTYETAGTDLKTMALPTGNYQYVFSDHMLTSVTSPDGVALAIGYNGTTIPQSQNFAIGSVSTSVSVTLNADFLAATDVVKASSASDTIAYSYNNDNLLTATGDETLARTNATGLVASTALGVVQEKFGYDSQYGELSSYSAKNATATIYSETLTRDTLGRIMTKTEVQKGASKTYVYGYDTQGRLHSVTGSATSTYNYAPNGDRSSTLLATSSTTYTSNNQDQLVQAGTTTYVYNLNGQLVSSTDSATKLSTTYAMDVLGNLKSVVLPNKTKVQYLVDGVNRRVAKLRNGTLSAIYVYDDGLRIAAVLSPSGIIVSRFVYADKRNVPEYMNHSGIEYKFVTDHLGSVREVVNTLTGVSAESISYDEFGRVLSDSNPGFQPFGFAGGLYDQDTKLVQFGAREYDASTGRWLSRDPLLFGGGDTNLYGYVANDPINFVDPRGTDITVNLYGGQTLLDPGHVGISINGGSSQGYYGNLGGNGSSGVLEGQNYPGALLLDHGAPSQSITLHTSPAQDQAVQNYLNGVQSNPGQYNLYSNNCATTASQALQSGGVSAPSGGWNFIPKYFFGGLQGGQ